MLGKAFSLVTGSVKFVQAAVSFAFKATLLGLVGLTAYNYRVPIAEHAAFYEVPMGQVVLDYLTAVPETQAQIAAEIPAVAAVEGVSPSDNIVTSRSEETQVAAAEEAQENASIPEGYYVLCFLVGVLLCQQMLKPTLSVASNIGQRLAIRRQLKKLLAFRGGADFCQRFERGSLFDAPTQKMILRAEGLKKQSQSLQLSEDEKAEYQNLLAAIGQARAVLVQHWLVRLENALKMPGLTDAQRDKLVAIKDSTKGLLA